MGNIAFNSFRKNMSDDDFTQVLEEVVSDRFGGKVVVRTEPWEDGVGSWVVEPREDLGGDHLWTHSLEWYRHGQRKFGTKHPHSDWGEWILIVIQNELAVRHNGRITDEGVEGSWAGDTNKYPTFMSWFERIYRRSKKLLAKDVYEAYMKDVLSHIPEELRNM
jgi:hypothetical protein